jgi:hypothetical protein
MLELLPLFQRELEQLIFVGRFVVDSVGFVFLLQLA